MSKNNGLMGFDPSRGELVPVAAVVDHPNKNEVRVRYRDDCSIAVFQQHGRPLEVMIACQGFESYRMKVEEPPPGQHMVLSRNPDKNEFLIQYRNDDK
jgi:hypothetical protein